MSSFSCRWLWNLMGLVILSACIHTSKPEESSFSSFYPPSASERSRQDYVQEAEKGMVVTAHPLASEAGLGALKAGGNAVDAAVAASFAVSVVRPQSTGIGGGGFALVYRPSEAMTRAFDFRERAPLTVSQDHFLEKNGEPKDFIYEGQNIPRASLNGHLAGGTPGLVHGLLELHERYGQLPLETLMAPAIQYARSGFPVYPSLARALERRQSILAHFPASRAVFFRDDRPLQTGETLTQEDLAWTLEQIRDSGRKAFYEGAVADKIVAEMQRSGGLISRKDLASYQTIERPVLKSQYRGYELHTMPPPSSGGVHIGQMLNILEGYDLRSKGYASASYYNYLIEAMRHAYADRATHLGDPDFYDVPVKGLLSKDYAAHIRQQIKPGKAADSETIGAGNPIPYDSPSTTHITVVDGDGMIVTSTQTINFGMGSGVVIPGTGIVLNNEMDDFSIRPGLPNAYGLLGHEANAIEPGKTMLSSMTPTLLFQDKQPIMALGSPGGSRIINAILQVIIHHIDFDMNLADAVHSHRVHHQWQPDKVWLEDENYAPQSLRELKEMGYDLEQTGFPVGDIQAIKIEKGRLIGVSDTRSDGIPLGW